MKTKLVVAFDTTGSMAPCIKEVRRRLKDFTDVVFSEIENLEVQFIAFGDYCDMPNHYFKSEETSDPEVLKDFVSRNHSTYGGDSDEFYEYVIKRVREETKWADNNVFILLGDAAPHDVGYTYGGKRYILHWEAEALKCADQGIQIYAVQALNKSRNSYFYRTISEITNGIKVDLHQLSHIVEYITAISLRASDNEEALDKYETKVNKGNRSLSQMFAHLRGRKVTFDKIYHSGEELIPVDPSRFQTLYVEEDVSIKPFVEQSGAKFKQGRGFYQFTKTETIQEWKEVVLRDKEGNFFSGNKAREMIGVPMGKRARLRPVYLKEFDIFVKSTSNNRKLKGGTEFLYEITD